MTQHTPGPWAIDESPSPVYGSNGTLIATGVRIGNIATCYTTGTKAAEKNQANARLIASAPDLLAALKALHQANAETFEGLPNYLDLWDDAAKAIAQAEGRN